MSLVGPRPERPMYVEQFRASVPRYMLRHHVKAGITGWAQIHGLRGDTPLDRRIEYDLYYVRNWSLGLDCQDPVPDACCACSATPARTDRVFRRDRTRAGPRLRRSRGPRMLAA